MILRRLESIVSIAFIFVAILFPSETFGENVITTNTLTRLFILNVGDEFGSGFTVEVNGKQYLITARHVMNKDPEATSIKILRNQKWETLSVRSIVVNPKTVDIAVLSLSQQISPVFPINVGYKGDVLSEQVFFLGYPLLLSIDGRTLNSGFPLPLVRHGILASMPTNDGEPFLVDGMNNPGMSGGPVVRVSNGNEPTIIGVISGYKIDQSPVYQQNQITDSYVKGNSGLVVAYPIDYAIDAINKDLSNLVK